MSLLGEVCGGLETESTSVMGAFGFSLIFVCFSLLQFRFWYLFGWWFIFGDCSYYSFYFLHQCLHFVYKLGNYFRFCGCFCFAHMIIFFVGDRIFFFVTFAYFVVSIILPSGYVIVLVCFNLVISFSFFYISQSLDLALVSLAVGTFVDSLIVFMYVIFRILVVVFTGLDGVRTSDICSILMDSGCRVLHLFFGIQF